ncbi:hypothetical protein ACSNOI_16700 [Actinomadura kijaniata]|uniref:hypothetical protein n=1 Tax=Actinomadura kijaniata TaxID=46161 RepID=UPI003F1DA2A1
MMIRTAVVAAGLAAGLTGTAGVASAAPAGPERAGDAQVTASATPYYVRPGDTVTVTAFTTADRARHRFCLQRGDDGPSGHGYHTVTCQWSTRQRPGDRPEVTFTFSAPGGSTYLIHRVVMMRGPHIRGVSRSLINHVNDHY